MKTQDIRNIAIIAHVDHGKTTLVEKTLKFCQNQSSGEKSFNSGLDNNELEKERGITIVSKNVSVLFKGKKINIIDTPGHADFGGEVQRVLNMADAALLLVDAFEGPMPQTRYVLSKAIETGKIIIPVINKVDKPNSRPNEVLEMVFDLMCALDATDEQLDFSPVFGSAKMGWMGETPENPTENFEYLLQTIVSKVPAPTVSEGGLQMQITSIDHSNYLGRIAVGRVYRGKIEKGSSVSLIDREGNARKEKVKGLFVYDEIRKEPAEEVVAGDICAVSGMDSFEIGETISELENPEALPNIAVDEPTMSMFFMVNNSPFFGKEGKFVTSRHLEERLLKEVEKNLALRVKKAEIASAYEVYGRGIMHLSVLIETMRREGYELQLGQPKVLFKTVDGKKLEPIESLYVDTPDAFSSKIINLVNLRKGQLLKMEEKGDMIHMEFEVPSRGLIGLRGQVLTLSSGMAVLNHTFKEYAEFKGPIPSRINGVIIAMDAGQATAYSLFNLQDRGRFFIGPGLAVYEGMIIGENSKETDLMVNVNKGKKLTNVRASKADEKIVLEPALKMTLEDCLEYIQADELVEVTPESIRLRKMHLKEHERKKATY